MKRRLIIKTNRAATTLGFLGNWGTRVQIRDYKQPNKPLLTDSNLTRFFSGAESKATFGALLQEASADIPSFLDKYFSLSPEQRKTVASLSVDRLARISEALTVAKQNNGHLDFKFVTDNHRCDEVIKVMWAKETRTIITGKPMEFSQLNTPLKIMPR